MPVQPLLASRRSPGVLAIALCTVILTAATPGIAAAADVSLKDFGADGSGRTDDTAALRKAIAFLTPAGGTLAVPAGRYLLSDAVIIGSGITVRGEGRGGPTAEGAVGSVFQLQSPHAGFVFRDARYSGICNVTVAGGGSSGSPAIAGPTAAVRLEDTYHCFIQQVLVLKTSAGIEILNGISPVLEDVDLKDLTGPYGVWVHGSGGVGPAHRKVDAGCFTRLSGGAEGNSRIEWLVAGPNVDGINLMYGRFVGGGRALVLRGGSSQHGDVRPKYIHTYLLGSDHAHSEAVLVEEGSDLFMVDTWIGQNQAGDGMVLGPRFTGGAELTNLRIRGSGGQGLHIMGGTNIYIVNPLIGACGTNRQLVHPGSEDGCGILIEKGVQHLRVTGGGVGPMYEMGSRAQQRCGIRYRGTAALAVQDSVRVSGVDTTGNAVELDPRGLGDNNASIPPN